MDARKAQTKRELAKLKVETVLKRLLERKVRKGETVDVSERELIHICNAVSDRFMEDPVCLMLTLDKPLCIVGDIYGQYDDILAIFEAMGYPPKQRYLFLGNYADRGPRPIEVLTILFTFKLKYPKHIFLLRGNHECEFVSCYYGLLTECLKRFTKNLWLSITKVFTCLPAVAIIEEKIFCTHSGIVPCVQYTSTENATQLSYYITDIIRRPVSVTDNFLLTHLTWSEPIVDMYTVSANPAGLGEWYGEQLVIDFCKRFGLQVVIRSNDYLETGYEFMANGTLLTIFSASQFGGVFHNVGAFVYMEKCLRTGQISSQIKVIRPIIVVNKMLGSTTRLVVEDSIEYQASGKPKKEVVERVVERMTGNRGRYLSMV